MPSDLNKTVVIDTGNLAIDGHLFDRDHLLNISHTLLPIHELALRLQSQGIACVTPEAILNNQAAYQGKRIYLISHLTSARTEALFQAGARPLLLLCQESPMIAARFYLSFRRLSGKFPYTMGFAGMTKRAHPATRFIPMRFPIMKHQPQVAPTPFNDKKLLALIAGNKAAPVWKSWLIKMFYGRKVKLIYPVRKQLVSALASVGAIDLYGRGWDQDPDPAVRASYQGPVAADGKLDTLSRYKFALCFENAIFPGYITEKIFDAFMAGTVPVYLGDPNVTDSIPPDCFIDARAYRDPASLKVALENMPEAEYQRLQEAGASYLQSPAFQEFTHGRFIAQIIDLVRSHE